MGTGVEACKRGNNRRKQRERKNRDGKASTLVMDSVDILVAPPRGCHVAIDERIGAAYRATTKLPVPATNYHGTHAAPLRAMSFALPTCPPPAEGAYVHEEEEEGMCGSRLMRALITGLTFFLCLGLMLSVSMIGGGRKAPPPVTVAIAASSRDRQHMRDRSFDPFYASERRVPKGPDPIHNR
ncbi:hypothetical protein BHE74_00027523 [Ensete ventricosum]|nr:hypothetical protein BHE74_00027523 [Ensete ventricosum]